MLKFNALDANAAAILLGDNAAKELIHKIRRHDSDGDPGEAGAEAMAALLDEMLDSGLNENNQTILQSFAMTLATELAYS